MPVIFKDGTFDDPYKVVSSFLTDYIAKNESYYDLLVVDLETTNLGRENVLALFNSDYCSSTMYSFEFDWYEGGDIIIHGYTLINNVKVEKIL
jgi:hypothetical protein